MNPHTYGHLIFVIGSKTIQWEKRQHFQQMVLVQLEVSMQKNANRSIISLIKFRFKWIKGLHIKPDMLKLTEEKVGKSVKHMGTGVNFMNRTSMACALRLTIDKWDLIRLQNFCKAKDIVNRTKQQPTDQGKYLYQSYIRQRANIQYIQNTSRSQTPENQITLLKMGYSAKQRILN